jgi:hypothetical protein
MYGYNFISKRYHGLVGAILKNLSQCRTTRIYARLETRRNYLSVGKLASSLFHVRPGGALIERSGCLNVQSSVSLSIFDVCHCFFQAIRRRPMLMLVRHAVVDAEHHFPSGLQGAKLMINDPVIEWIRWNWKKSVRLSQS